MDEDISRWILEFLLRQPIPDNVVSKALSLLPLPNHDSRFKKTLLLRSIQGQTKPGSTLTETVLDNLELVEELDRLSGVAVTDSMRVAYCAVAVCCTLEYVGDGEDMEGKYFSAVMKIWREKVDKMEGKSGLFSDELAKWKDEIEAALLNGDARRNFLKKKSNVQEQALSSLKSYLEEAWAIMGPPFLESAAKAMMTKQGSSMESEQTDSFMKVTAPSEHDLTRDVEGSDGGIVELGDQMVNQPAVQGLRDQHGSGQDLRGDDSVRAEVSTQLVSQEVHGSGNKQAGEADGKMVGKSHRKKHAARRRCIRRRAEIVDTDDSGSDVPCTRNDPLPSPEVRQVQEALKTSNKELQAMVKDPLPDALKVSEAVRSELQRKQMSDQNRPTQDTERTSEPVQAAEANTTSQKNDARPGWLQRNATARTYEWEDSIDSDTSVGTSRGNERIHLPTPARIDCSPLKNVRGPKISKRRRPKKWSILEEDTLRTGVHLYGKGNWKLILTKYSDIFEERTDCDLKDKWRNMTRYGGQKP